MGNFVKGTIGSTNDRVAFGPSGPMRVTIQGTWSGVLVLRSTLDNTTYVIERTFTENPDPPTIRVSCDSGNGSWDVIATQWTSGTATVIMADA